MLDKLAVLVFEGPESPANHPIVLWGICVGVTAFFLVFLAVTKSSWKVPAGKTGTKISTDRAEKSCDAVLSVCALLIPATLGLLTWLHEKIGAGSYVVPLGFALIYFFALLVFTAHLRFNFLWRYDQNFEVTPTQNLRFAYWLTTATSSIVLGLALLSIPIVELGLGWLTIKEPAQNSAVKVDCNCKPADAGARPVSSSTPTPNSQSHKSKTPATPKSQTRPK